MTPPRRALRRAPPEVPTPIEKEQPFLFRDADLKRNVEEAKPKFQGFLGKTSAGDAAPLKPSPFYFGGIQRGKLGDLRSLLKEAGLRGVAMLRLSFVGGSILEVLAHEPSANRLIATMTSIGFRFLPDFSPTANGLQKKHHAELDAAALLAKNQEMLTTRWEVALRRCKNNIAQSWYRGQLTKLTGKAYEAIPTSKTNVMEAAPSDTTMETEIPAMTAVVAEGTEASGPDRPTPPQDESMAETSTAEAAPPSDPSQQ